MWLDHVFAEVFGFDVAFEPATADLYFDTIGETRATEAFRPRALFDRFRIDFIATTEGAHDSLDAHHRSQASDWNGRVVTPYRPAGELVRTPGDARSGAHGVPAVRLSRANLAALADLPMFRRQQ